MSPRMQAEVWRLSWARIELFILDRMRDALCTQGAVHIGTCTGDSLYGLFQELLGNS